MIVISGDDDDNNSYKGPALRRMQGCNRNRHDLIPKCRAIYARPCSTQPPTGFLARLTRPQKPIYSPPGYLFMCPRSIPQQSRKKASNPSLVTTVATTTSSSTTPTTTTSPTTTPITPSITPVSITTASSTSGLARGLLLLDDIDDFLGNA